MSARPHVDEPLSNRDTQQPSLQLQEQSHLQYAYMIEQQSRNESRRKLSDYSPHLTNRKAPRRAGTGSELKQRDAQLICTRALLAHFT